MIVGDFMDAMAGYKEGESERIKSIAELIRTSTTLIWNTQVTEESRMKPGELWKFGWDVAAEASSEEVPDEIIKNGQAAQDEILKKM